MEDRTHEIEVDRVDTERVSAIEILDLSEKQLEVLHNPDRGALTEVEYRLAWTRTYLKTYGILDNSSRGIWALTTKGNETEKVDPKKVTRDGREQYEKSKQSTDVEEKAEPVWRSENISS